MLVDEVNPTMIRYVPHRETQDSVAIREGSNFHWGRATGSEKGAAKPKGAKPAVEQAKGKSNALVYGDDKASLNERLLTGAGQQQTLETFLTLKDLDITIKQGEFVCIIGDVGSGKSSLLNAIVGDLLYADP